VSDLKGTFAFTRDVLLCQEVTGEDQPEEKAKAAVGGLFGRAKRAAQVKACLLAEHLPPACSLFLWSALYLCMQKLL